MSTPAELSAKLRSYIRDAEHDGHTDRHISDATVGDLRDVLEAVDSLQAQVEVLREALRTLLALARWQAVEGADHHPTLPSAIAKACAALSPIKASDADSEVKT